MREQLKAQVDELSHALEAAVAAAAQAAVEASFFMI